MKCAKCGKKVGNNVKFCPDCGTKLLKKEISEDLKTPKWYLITSIIISLIFFILAVPTHLGITGSFIGPAVLYLLFGGLWWIFNFVMLIFFLAKKYRKNSIILPITFLVQVILIPTVFELGGYYSYDLFLYLNIIFPLIVVSYSLYNLWRK